MPTTLQDARRALLELQHMPIHAESHIGTRLKTIEQYLNAQVALNVESLPAHIVSTAGYVSLVDLASDDQCKISETVGVPRTTLMANGQIISQDIEKGEFVFVAGGDPDALKPETGDRRYMIVAGGGAGAAGGAPWCYAHGNYKHYCNCQSGAGIGGKNA